MSTVAATTSQLSPQHAHVGHDHNAHSGRCEYDHGHTHGIGDSDSHDPKQSGDCCGHDHDDADSHDGHHCASHAHDHGNTHHAHGGECGHSHSGWKQYAPHGHSLHTRLAADKRALTFALSIQAMSFIIQLTGAIIASSSMLVVESLHSLVDGLTVVLSLISTVVAAYPPTTRLTYGYGRAEVLSALLSLVALAMLCIKLAVRAFSRVYATLLESAPDVAVNGRIVVLAETITLTANIGMAVVLSRGTTSSLNIRAVRAHVIADSLENFVVLVAGAVIWMFPKAALIDPLLTVFVVVMLVTLNFRIARETVEVVMQAAPPGIAEEAYKGLDEIGSVVRVDSLHVWTVTTGVVVASARVFVQAASGLEEVGRVRKAVTNVLKQAGAQDTCVEVILLSNLGHLGDAAEGKTTTLDIIDQHDNTDDEITVSLVENTQNGSLSKQSTSPIEYHGVRVVTGEEHGDSYL